jgi:NADH dehydrogenase (ubiquinone) 1 beta subcomplex subunit 8
MINLSKHFLGRTRYPMSTMVAAFFGYMGFWFGLYFWLEDKKMFPPVLPKAYPNDGKPHYSYDTK